MIRQYINTLYIRERREEVAQFFQVFILVGDTWNEDVTNPYRLVDLAQIAGTIQYILIGMKREPENIQTLGEMIKDFDLDVKIAEGGQEAIDIIDSCTPDIILLDLMMPRVNGWDVIDHVRKKYSKNEMVIIVVSLLNNKDNIDECYELGVNDYITKPVIKARLTSSIESHLRNLSRN